MIEGRCACFREDQTLREEWTQKFVAVPRAGEFVQGPNEWQQGQVLSVTHCEDVDGEVFLGIVLE